LGLYIVRQIAQAHGGSVTASSEDGVVKFTVQLPLATTD
jgi:signal transduction histidine kinase